MSIFKSFLEPPTQPVPSWLPPTSSLRRTRTPSPGGSPPASSSGSLATSQGPVSHSNRNVNEGAGHPLRALERNEADIRRQLQLLLDAQAEGLQAGLGNQGRDGQSSDGESSIDSRSVRYSKTMPVRQPTHKPTSLRSARKGIRDAMVRLAIVKEKESKILEEELQSGRDSENKITGWEARRDGLNKEIDEIRRGPGSLRAHELRDERDALQEQINAIENQLAELKSQQSAVNLELSRLENSVQSKLSSYSESLKIIDSEVSDFLARPPYRISQSLMEETSYLSLPPQRRTLDLAMDFIKEEKNVLVARQHAIGEEQEALEEGLAVWNDVIDAVTDFERNLRAGIQKMGESADNAPRSMNELLEQMDQILLDLNSKYELAEARGWKLLVCCIGAELEAFQKGRDILQSASSASTRDVSPDSSERIEDPPSNTQWPPRETANVASSGSFRRSFDRGSIRAFHLAEEEPDVDLLVSRQDTDTE